MSDRVEPGPDKAAKMYATTTAMRWVSVVDGWIAPDTEAYAADVDTGVTGAPLNAAAASTSTNSLTVTIDTFEGFIDGRWVARDVTTDVTLSASTAGQTVYAGWNFGSSNSVIVGLDGDFTANDGRVPIWTFDTDGSGVTAETDERNVGPLLEEQSGDLVINALLSVTGGVDVPTGASITTTNTGMTGAPLQVLDGNDDVRTAFGEDNQWATIWNDAGNGVRFVDPTGKGTLFFVGSDGDAAFPAGSTQLRVENRTNDPSNPDAGRLWYRTDLE